MSQIEFVDGNPDHVRVRGIELHSGDIGIVELNEAGDGVLECFLEEPGIAPHAMLFVTRRMMDPRSGEVHYQPAAVEIFEGGWRSVPITTALHPRFSWYSEWVRPNRSGEELPADIGEKLSSVLDELEIFAFDFQARAVPVGGRYTEVPDGSTATCSNFVRVPLERAGVTGLPYPTTAAHSGATANLAMLGLNYPNGIYTPTNILNDSHFAKVGIVDNGQADLSYASGLVIGRPEWTNSFGGWLSQKSLCLNNLPSWKSIRHWRSSVEALKVKLGQSNSMIGRAARSVFHVTDAEVPKSASETAIAYYLRTAFEAGHIIENQLLHAVHELFDSSDKIWSLEELHDQETIDRLCAHGLNTSLLKARRMVRMSQRGRDDYSVQELGERFTLLSDQTIEYALFFVGTDGTIKTWNVGAQRLFGYSAKEIVGKRFTELFTSEDLAASIPETGLSTAFSQGKSTRSGTQKRKDGTAFQCETAVTAIMDENDEVHIYAVVVRDNTTSDAAKIQAARVTELIAYYEQTQSFFLMLAHELQSPLAPICTAIELIRRADPSHGYALDVVDLLQRQVDLLRGMINNLSDISRISTANFKVFPELSNLNTLVHEACNESQAIFDNLSQCLKRTMSQVPVWVNVDRRRIHQVMMNLLSNSSKFTGSGGKIEVAISTENGCALVKVLDNGIGLKQSMIPHIFDLFPPAGEQPVKTRGGLGLGLAISRSIAELHHGSLTATSSGLASNSPDLIRGSEFCLRLPLAPEPLEQEFETSPCDMSDAAMSSAVIEGPLRVLVISDQADFAQALQEMLVLIGCSAQWASTSAEAVSRGREFAPQVVLLDMEFQIASPYAIAEQVDEVNGYKPRIMISLTNGPPSEGEVIRGLKSRFNSFLEKPIDFNRLKSLLNSAWRVSEHLA